MKTIILDAGHGGMGANGDPGAIGVNGMKEKDINLSVTLKIADILRRHNVTVLLTRSTDVFVKLQERARSANVANASVFVSIHCNAFKDANAQGVEVYHYPKSYKGFELSKSILDEILADKLYTKDRGVKQNDFAVLRLSKMPAALVELAFITNTEDANILKCKQDELAESVAKGILSYLEVTYKEVTQKDGVYADAVKVLVEHRIIGTPSAWEDSNAIKPQSARSLIIKVADYVEQGIPKQ